MAFSAKNIAFLASCAAVIAIAPSASAELQWLRSSAHACVPAHTTIQPGDGLEYSWNSLRNLSSETEPVYCPVATNRVYDEWHYAHVSVKDDNTGENVLCQYRAIQYDQTGSGYQYVNDGSVGTGTTTLDFTYVAPMSNRVFYFMCQLPPDTSILSYNWTTTEP